MKKLIFGLLACACMLGTSCSADDNAEPDLNNIQLDGGPSGGNGGIKPPPPPPPPNSDYGG